MSLENKNKNKKKFLILIQARLHSTRLPGKALFIFFNNTIIERVIKISKKTTNKKNIFILTGSKKKNNLLLPIAKKNHIQIFFGNEKNVFLRFKNFLKKKLTKKYTHICRLTADNYLIQPSIIKKMMIDAAKGDIDYSYVSPLSHYAGEIISKNLFFKLKFPTKLAKEHVTWDFRKNKKLKILEYPKNFFGLNHSKSLTLDTIDDLLKMKKLEKKYKNLKKINNIRHLIQIQNKFKL